MKRKEILFISLLIVVMLIACHGEPKPAPFSIEGATNESMPAPAEAPKPTESSGTPLWINPEIGKHEVRFTVSVENPDPPDEYEIKQISESPRVETEGRVSERVIKKFWELYERVPESLRNEYESEAFTIRITKKNLAEYYNGSVEGSINGIFSYQRKMIFLYGTESALGAAMLHEFGHYLDWKCGFPSRTEAFSVIYEAENAFAGTNPNVSDPTEFFAEVFQAWVLQDAEQFPQTVACIRSEMDAHFGMACNEDC